MTECNTEKKAAQPKRTRWKLLRRAVACLLLLLVIFHRPLLRTAVRITLTRAAALGHLRLTLDVGGPVLNGLVLKNVRAVSDGHGPVNRIEAAEIRLRYNFISLFKHGPDAFLNNAAVRDAVIEITPPPDSSKNDTPASVMKDVMHPDFFCCDRIRIENLNVITHGSNGDFRMLGTDALLDTGREGFVRIKTLQVPKVHTWRDLHALATYKGRNLAGRNFSRDDQVQLITAEYAPNPAKGGSCRMSLHANAFGGSVTAQLTGKRRGKFIRSAIFSASLHGVSPERVFAYFDLPFPPGIGIRDLSFEMSGNPDLPSSWAATGSTQFEPGTIGAAHFENASLRISATNSSAHGESQISDGLNSVRIVTDSQLPEKLSGLAGTAVNGVVQFSAGEPARIDPRITGGAVSGTGTFSLSTKNYSTGIKMYANGLSGTGFSMSRAAVTVECSGTTYRPRPFSAFLDGLKTQIAAEFQDFTAGSYALDSGTITLATNSRLAEVSTLGLKRGPDSIDAHGKIELPQNPCDWRSAAFNGAFAMNAPALNAIYTEPMLTGLNGRLAVTGTVARSGAGINGRLSVTGTGLSFAEFTADKLELEAPIANSVATIERFELGLNATDGISGGVRIALRAPFAYDGNLTGKIRDLSAFNPVLQAFGFNQPVAGALSIDWRGSGDATSMRHSGAGNLKLQNGRLGALKPIEIGIDGNYSPESVDFPALRIEVGPHKAEAVVRFHNSQLDVSGIKYQLNHLEVATGTIGLTGSGTGIAGLREGAVSADLAMKDLPLQSLAPGVKLPLSGTVTGTLLARGSIDRLEADLQIRGHHLQSALAGKLAPATLGIDLRLRENRLALSGTVSQREIAPLQIAGEIPLPVRQIISEGRLDEQSPVALSVKLPNTPVAFLTQLIPDLRFAEGRVSIDAGVAGTIAKPELRGTVLLDLPAVRFKRPDWPAINGFKGDLVFAGNRLTVNRFGGEISGGTVSLGGKVDFVKLTEPVLDLRLTTQGALLARNETITVRADSEIKISGPLNSADVTGQVGITKSRFFREIELLPIQLPGRPAPKPPESQGGFSFKTAPLRDMKFKVAIKTKDPFLIRGNLTNGTAVADLKLGGTGFAPTLDGSIRIENLTATLPFSTLEVSYGFIYFNPKDPFVPTLDIQATSSLRDYNISASIYGNAANPQTVLSSEPPLPQEEILALLATGATTMDRAGNTDVLAGRAAVLVFQKFYYKIFKRQETSGNESFLNRFQIDVGGVDPRTGKQEVSARFKLGEKFYLIGSVDLVGDIHGQVKYLLQFR